MNEVGRVGYIGLGNMGGGIATHLARAGIDLTVFDIQSERVDALVKEGAKAAPTVRGLVQAVDIIVVCVFNAEQLRALTLGPDGILEATRAGQVIVLNTTVLPDVVQDIAAVALKKCVEILDAPVSGSIEDRFNGTLSVMVGGNEDIVARVRPLLETIGHPVIYAGVLGNGELAKIANNSIMLATRIAAIETMRWAVAYGMSEELIREVCAVSSADSWVLDNWAYLDQQTLIAKSGDAAPQTLEAVEAARRKGIDLPLNQAIVEVVGGTERGRRATLLSRTE